MPYAVKEILFETNSKWHKLSEISTFFMYKSWWFYRLVHYRTYSSQETLGEPYNNWRKILLKNHMTESREIFYL